jgi:ectoine hydroxylase-related dioxygenase (phytanoyl-CoA dioxygenase family)
MTYHVTDEERSAETIAADKLADITADIASKGYAVVSGLIPSEICEMLMASILEDAQQIRALGKPTPHEERTGKGHLQLGLRRYAPYVQSDLVANPIIESIVAGVLGQGAWLGFYSGNVNLPGSTYQPLHYDRPFSWKTEEEAREDGVSWPPPATTLSCSVALTEITEENGATEIYPGTHRETAVTEWPLGERPSKHPELVERWGPPGRMVIPAGGICFRDPRMWHRGVPNLSDQVRPMMALTYHAGRCRQWRGRLVRSMSQADIEKCLQDPTLRVMDDGELGDGRLVFEESAREAFTQVNSLHGIDRNARFVSEPLKVNHFLDPHGLGGARVVSGGVVSPDASETPA